MGYQLNSRAVELVIRALRGEITDEEARRKLQLRKRMPSTECEIGAYGVCRTHGQVSTDCERDNA